MKGHQGRSESGIDVGSHEIINRARVPSPCNWPRFFLNVTQPSGAHGSPTWRNLRQKLCRELTTCRKGAKLPCVAWSMECLKQGVRSPVVCVTQFFTI